MYSNLYGMARGATEKWSPTIPVYLRPLTVYVPQLLVRDCLLDTVAEGCWYYTLHKVKHTCPICIGIGMRTVRSLGLITIRVSAARDWRCGREEGSF